MKSGIYKITSPSNRTYIGMSLDIDSRWNNYKYPCNIKQQKLLYNSLIKYGVENHVFNIVELLEPDINKLCDREKYWIEYYNCYNTNTGLNLTKGGNNPPLRNTSLSEEHKNKIKQALIGKSRSEETKEKIRLKRKLQIIPKEVYQNNAIKKMKPCILYDKINNYVYKAQSLNEMSVISGISKAWLSRIKNKETEKYKFEYV